MLCGVLGPIGDCVLSGSLQADPETGIFRKWFPGVMISEQFCTNKGVRETGELGSKAKEGHGFYWHLASQTDLKGNPGVWRAPESANNFMPESWSFAPPVAVSHWQMINDQLTTNRTSWLAEFADFHGTNTPVWSMSSHQHLISLDAELRRALLALLSWCELNGSSKLLAVTS